MKSALLFIIRFYRRAISRYLGENCRFYPSCSDYAEQAVMKKGVFRGLALAVRRLLKCQPFHPGGCDAIG